jgi:EcsC protein family
MSNVTITPPLHGMTAEDRADLARAVNLLEHASLAARVTNLIGHQVDLAGHMIPERARAIAGRATTLALRAALHVAMRGVAARKGPASSMRHKAMAAATGAAGGAFGLAALPVELPASTILMLRSIADIAREHGEDVATPEAALACLQVFALGGRTLGGDEHMNSSYFAARAMLARSITEATRYIVERGVADEAAPVLVRLVAQIAARFGVVVTQKVAAQAIPVLGALGGAAVNYAFIDHFQSMARGHFTVRRLERAYGAEPVRQEYQRLLAKDGGA